MITEADTCRKYILPKLQTAGWETDPHSVLTTSQLLTTGVDAPSCKNEVLARVVNSITEFKQKDFFDQFGGEAKAILNDLLEKYEHGTAQFIVPDVLKVPPIPEYGNFMQIIQLCGRADKLRDAVNQLETLLYAA